MKGIRMEEGNENDVKSHGWESDFYPFQWNKILISYTKITNPNINIGIEISIPAH